jgi:hypothetical protein
MDGVAGYYEPLNEMLASVRSGTLASINGESWPSGHRSLDRPYFDEYRPPLKRNGSGVQGYYTRFAVDDFFAAPDTALPELDHYLRRTIRTAEERGEQPVLKFCRSVGRIGWMQRHMPLLLLAMHRDLPMVNACIRHLGTELPSPPECHSLGGRLAAYEASVRSGSPAAWYRGFLAFWALAAAAMPDAMDLIINGDLLEHSSRYRRQCEFELAMLTGQMVDFGEACCSDFIKKTDATCLRCSEFLDAHRGADRFLAEQVGVDWANKPNLGGVAMLLTETVRQASCLEGPVFPKMERDLEVMLSAMGRAAWAERELAAVHASRSWRITAPLRWLRSQLRQV